ATSYTGNIAAQILEMLPLDMKSVRQGSLAGLGRHQKGERAGVEVMAHLESDLHGFGKGRRDKGRHLLRPGVAALLGQFRRVWLQRAGRQADSFPSQSLHE